MLVLDVSGRPPSLYRISPRVFVFVLGFAPLLIGRRVCLSLAGLAGSSRDFWDSRPASPHAIGQSTPTV